MSSFPFLNNRSGINGTRVRSEATSLALWRINRNLYILSSLSSQLSSPTTFKSSPITTKDLLDKDPIELSFAAIRSVYPLGASCFVISHVPRLSTNQTKPLQRYHPESAHIYFQLYNVSSQRFQLCRRRYCNCSRHCRLRVYTSSQSKHVRLRVTFLSGRQQTTQVHNRSPQSVEDLRQAFDTETRPIEKDALVASEEHPMETTSKQLHDQQMDSQDTTSKTASTPTRKDSLKRKIPHDGFDEPEKVCPKPWKFWSLHHLITRVGGYSGLSSC